MIKRFITMLLLLVFVFPSFSSGGGIVYPSKHQKLTNKYGYTNKWMNPYTLYPGKHSGVYSEELKRDNRERWVKEQYEKQRFNTPTQQVLPNTGGTTYYKAPRRGGTSSIMISRGTVIITYEIRERVYERTGKLIPYKITICQLAGVLKTHFADLAHYKNITEYIEEQCIR